MKDILVGFRSFLMRGNLIELAVAIVIGLAFVELIDSLVSNLVTPIIALIFGEPDLSSLDFTINDAVFGIGSFLNELIQFIAIAAAVYFFIVVPYNSITARMKRGQPEPNATTKICPECANTIPIEARRCGFCTAQLAGV
jgi:large conductance mechanosensitive channel